MTSFDNCVENHGKRIIFFNVSIDGRKKIKEDVVFVLKANTHKQIVFQKRNLSDYHKCCIGLKIEKILENLNQLESLRNQVKELRLQDKQGKQNSQKKKKSIGTSY